MSLPLVDDSYIDAFRERRPIAAEVRAAVMAAMGLAPGEEPEASPSVAIVPRGAPIPARGELWLEDGTSLGRCDAMPSDAPYGYHRLLLDDGAEQRLITGPGRCHLPRGPRGWGWAIQLAATRSTRSWGIGDLGDLRELAGWSADRGASFIAVSPLGAPNPGPIPEASPYYPSTRRFGNPLHLRVEDIPATARIDDLAVLGRALNDERLIDRARVLAAKREALDRIWAAGLPDRAAFEAWRSEQGRSLERWSVFAALSERFGPGWTTWPAEYRDPDGPAVRRTAVDDPDRVSFHAWVQWCLDRQVATASAPLRRIADMPVGVDPGGFDAWDWQDQLAMGASIGAPPDRFNAAGQDWGLPPFIPHRLRAAGYEPFVETIRAQLRHAGGLRIDHVLGLFRLWWIPDGSSPAFGAYVRYPTDELLEIVALESHRAEAIIVGEDLGTVSTGVRDELRRRNLLSTRLVLFERVPPERYPRHSFAGVTTHDLPTMAGIWGGSDLADQAAAGVVPDASARELLRQRLADASGLEPDADLDQVVDAVHQRLAGSPAGLVAATLEDALRIETRPNVPGTVAPQRANWSHALPPLEEIERDPRVTALVETLQR